MDWLFLTPFIAVGIVVLLSMTTSRRWRRNNTNLMIALVIAPAILFIIGGPSAMVDVASSVPLFGVTEPPQGFEEPVKNSDCLYDAKGNVVECKHSPTLIIP